MAESEPQYEYVVLRPTGGHPVGHVLDSPEGVHEKHVIRRLKAEAPAAEPKAAVPDKAADDEANKIAAADADKTEGEAPAE